MASQTIIANSLHQTTPRRGAPGTDKSEASFSRMKKPSAQGGVHSVFALTVPGVAPFSEGK